MKSFQQTAAPTGNHYEVLYNTKDSYILPWIYNTIPVYLKYSADSYEITLKTRSYKSRCLPFGENQMWASGKSKASAYDSQSIELPHQGQTKPLTSWACQATLRNVGLEYKASMESKEVPFHLTGKIYRQIMRKRLKNIQKWSFPCLYEYSNMKE